MVDESSAGNTKESKVNSVNLDKDYFTYTMRPREISLDTYLKVYEAFCESYRIKVTEDDKRNFAYLINKRIINRHNPEGVDYKPKFGAGEYGNARLYVMPKSNCVRFRSYPINSIFDNEDFVKLVNNSFKKSKDKKKDLESRL